MTDQTAVRPATAGAALPAPLIGFMGASECVRRGIHYRRQRGRYRGKHPGRKFELDERAVYVSPPEFLPPPRVEVFE